MGTHSPEDTNVSPARNTRRRSRRRLQGPPRAHRAQRQDRAATLQRILRQQAHLPMGSHQEPSNARCAGAEAMTPEQMESKLKKLIEYVNRLVEHVNKLEKRIEELEQE